MEEKPPKRPSLAKKKQKRKEKIGAGKGNWCTYVSSDENSAEIKVGAGTLISVWMYEQLATAN